MPSDRLQSNSPDDYHFSEGFLKDEIEAKGKLSYRSYVWGAIRQGDILAAVAYFRRAEEKGVSIDPKEVCQSVLINLIAPEEPATKAKWGSVLPPLKGDKEYEPKKFNPEKAIVISYDFKKTFGNIEIIPFYEYLLTNRSKNSK